jgi:nucleotide-binding universal stress UspA family protein
MILCGVHEHPDSGSAVAYAVWLGGQLHMPVEVAAATSRQALLAESRAQDARLLIVAASGDPGDGVLSLVHHCFRPVIVLSEQAAAPWRVPHRAQQGTRPLIVAGVDGSEPSLAAAAEAADLTEGMDSWLVLVHAREDPVPHGAPWPSADDPLGEADADTCQSLARHVLAKLGGTEDRAGVRHVFGNPVEALDGVASREAAALIAVGSHGLGRNRVALSGSVSAALIRQASRPVLVLSPRAVARRIAGLRSHPASAPLAHRHGTPA